MEYIQFSIPTAGSLMGQLALHKGWLGLACKTSTYSVTRLCVWHTLNESSGLSQKKSLVQGSSETWVLFLSEKYRWWCMVAVCVRHNNSRQSLTAIYKLLDSAHAAAQLTSAESL